MAVPSLRILHIAGARPNFVKIAPLMNAFDAYPAVDQRLVHTGQHYNDKLSDIFFEELEIPQPDVNLAVGSASHSEQTGRIMIAFERVCLEHEPDLVIVVGDVNSTLACSLTAAKLRIPVAHVEAGLRSFDRSMPEELNRVVTDHASDLLFTTEPSANENLLREGIPAERIHHVGNVMIDSLLRYRESARGRGTLARLGLEPRDYALVTLHRPSNVDEAPSLGEILDALAELSNDVPVVLPAHPRTRQSLGALGLEERLGGVRFIDPLGYIDFLAAMDQAAVVLTDSGGIQEETSVLGVPCLTLRPNTERPITIEQGTNRLVKLERGAIVKAAREALAWRGNGSGPQPAKIELWDGRAAERIARIVAGLSAPTSSEQ